MKSSFYEDQRIRRLSASIPYQERLVEARGSSEKRSPICGSRVTIDVNIDECGRINEVGMLVKACLLGQASSAILAAEIVGKSPDELATARDELAAWLDAGAKGQVLPAPAWPGLDVFAPALVGYTGRHAAIRLAFEAAAEAAALAVARGEPQTVDATG